MSEVEEKKIFNKPENEFFKVKNLEDWSFLNFLNYRYMVQVSSFTNNERYENGYYSAFIDAYKNIDNIDINQANKLRENYKVNKNFFDSYPYFYTIVYINLYKHCYLILD